MSAALSSIAEVVKAMAEKRKDSKGRILRDGESQMKDGRYRYQYMDSKGKRCVVYGWKLVGTDRTPAGKRDGISLREKIKQINRDVEDGIKTAANSKVTLNNMFDLYMAGKYELKESTRSNYLYMYENYVSDEIGRKKVASIKYSDIKAFYNSLIREKGFKPNSMEIIGLRWQDCDFENRTISINHNLIYRVYRQQGNKSEMYITMPKTSAGCRTIPMLDEVRQALLQEKQQQMKKRV